MAVRRALALSAVDRYAAMMISLAVFAATGRILGPAEVGMAVLGLTAYALIEIIRDVPTAYLVQQPDASVPAVRSAFTVMAAISVVFAVALFLAAPTLAHVIGNDDMYPFFRIVAAALLLGPFERPLVALMRRDLAFDRVALVNIASGACNAIVVVGLALVGFEEVSFAWALLAGNLAAVAAAWALSPYRRMLGLAISEWRKVMLLGGSSGLWGLIWRYTDSLPQIAFGALAQPAAAGTYSRAQTIVELPGKLLFVVVSQVALPALAAQRRDGRELKAAVLESIAIISALQWPAFLLVACLAHPLVLLLLGPRWLEVVPLVQLLAIARLFAPLELMVYPLLLSARATGRLLLSAAIPACLYTPVIFAMAPFGALAVAGAYLALIPLNTVVGYMIIRRELGLRLAEIAGALSRSALVALGSAVGPLAVLAANGFRFDLPLGAATAVILTAGAGWAAAVVASGHRLCPELRSIALLAWRWAQPRLRVGS
ncbi:oligosaccharide flippase family protein [Neoroseomonas oryzicola]|uniref:Oligosaccharide flippase family protein n=1 Tax=Neoroseomonas oryzicola TaxID=535904 RepID=A0A9X9WHT0_9PROT|nr:oligosaccharide flippase family protein [Neoroseomonas oryzicola]MBR0659890.1 oligosaccharide flippase family protein [Neoroseomonas oryzicola]NKE15670.1 oligosaccharide flippase family protein [Neoroseomonas oryzicola]